MTITHLWLGKAIAIRRQTRCEAGAATWTWRGQVNDMPWHEPGREGHDRTRTRPWQDVAKECQEAWQEHAKEGTERQNHALKENLHDMTGQRQARQGEGSRGLGAWLQRKEEERTCKTRAHGPNLHMHRNTSTWHDMTGRWEWQDRAGKQQGNGGRHAMRMQWQDKRGPRTGQGNDNTMTMTTPGQDMTTVKGTWQLNDIIW